jgi:aminopeptidase
MQMPPPCVQTALTPADWHTVATSHLRDVLGIAMDHSAEQRALVVHDNDSALACILQAAYCAALPHAEIEEFTESDPDRMLAAFNALGPRDLVVLVQSQSFRLPNYRIRVELYKRSVKVIEHTNLAHIQGDEVGYYIDALAYDAQYYRGIGRALCALMNASSSVRIQSGAETLEAVGGLESAKINIGDFSTLANVGSQFPIGEVFSEARDLTRVSGRAQLYAFTNTARRLEIAQQPITITVELGRIVASEPAHPEFEAVLAQIRADEGEVWVREIGFGMNRGFSPTRTVADVGAFERVCGVHLSLGAKHGVYKKAHIKYREARHHVDVFVATGAVWLDEQQVFADGAWQVAQTHGQTSPG